MPRSRSRGRKRKRSTSRIRSRSSRARTSTRIPRSLIPRTRTVYLRYGSNFSITPPIPSIAGYAEYTYGANCLYDPNISGTGHQPLGFDQMMAFYSRYRVLSSKFSAWGQGTQNQDVFVGWSNSGVNTTMDVNLPSRTCELQNTAFQWIPALSSAGATSGVIVNNSSRFRVSKNYVASRMSGDSKDTDYTGSATANPVTVHNMIFFIGVSSTTGVIGTAQKVEMCATFKVLFYDPNTLLSS